MISFTLLLTGTFPIDSNHSPCQGDRLTETTKEKEHTGLPRTAQGHTNTCIHTPQNVCTSTQVNTPQYTQTSLTQL